MERTLTAKPNGRNIADVLKDINEESNIEDRAPKRSRVDENKPKENTSKFDNANQILQDDLKEGTRVVLRGCNSVRQDLRGQRGKLVKFTAKHSRWLVSLDCGSSTYAAATSLELETRPAASLEQPDDAARSCDPQQRPAPPFVRSHELDPPSVQTLSTHFEGCRSQAMQLVEKTTCDTCAEVAQLRADVNQHCTRRPADFVKYCQMGKPTNFEQQQARNRVRQELLNVAKSVMELMQRLHDVSDAPSIVLQKERDTLLQEISEARESLDNLHKETIETFAACAEKVDVDRRNAESTISSLSPQIDNVNTFMQYVYQEIQNENAEADRMHEEMLVKLEEDEKRFVADINSESQAGEVHSRRAALQESHAERTRNHEAQTDMMQTWDSMLRLMPAKQRDQETHKVQQPRLGFWSRFASNFRNTAAVSA